MKTKLLAAFMLALTLTVTVCALPALTNVIETAGEATAEASDYSETTAEVMAVTSTVPGLNVFTGNTNVETFDGYTQSDIDSMFTLSNDGVELTPAEDTVYGTVIKGEGKSAEKWTNFFNQISTSIDRPAFYYMNYKLDTTAVGSGETVIWVINLVGSKPNFSIPATASGEWLTASVNNSNYIWGNKLHTFNMKFSGNGSIYVDNYALVPWYKITYKNIDENGNALGEDTVLYYIADDTSSVTVENGAIKGIATSYTVDHTKRLTSNNSSYLNTGWTTTKGSDVFATSVALNNNDIVLYPVWENVGEDVVLYETFEDVADGTLIRQYGEDGSSVLYNKHFSANTKGILEKGEFCQGDQKANMSVVDFNGNKVMKITKVPGYSSAYRMVTLNLTTDSAGNGLTVDQPGKYTIGYKYYIDDDADLSSIWFRSYYSNSNNHTYSNSSGLTKGNWYTYNTSFEIKDDGYSYYGKTFTNKQPVAPYLKRFDFVHSYNSAASDVLYYIDDVVVTYVPSRHLTVNYKDSHGNVIKSVDTLHYDDVGAKLVTSADLGLDYDAAFTYNGKKYYPGQHIKAASDASAVDVVVSNTRVVYVKALTASAFLKTAH